MAVVHVCLNSSCTSLGASNLIRDIEEMSNGQCQVEEWGCLGKCGKGPNIEVLDGGSRKVTQGVTDFKKAKGILENQCGVDVGGNVKKLGKMKFEIRREEDAGVRIEKINSALTTLGGEDTARKTEPKLVSELLVMRSREMVKVKIDDAIMDATKAMEYAPMSVQAKLAFGNVCELSSRFTLAIASLKEALDIGKGINVAALKRQITRLERKVSSGAENNETPLPTASSAADAKPAAAGKAKAKAKAVPKKQVSGEKKSADAPEKKSADAPEKKSADAPEKKLERQKSADALERQKSSSKKNTSSTKKSSSTTKDKKDKDNAKEKPKEVPQVKEEIVPVQRSPLDLLEWEVESVSSLNHDCILMKMKTLNMDTTKRDADPGAVWHVDFLQEGEDGKELKRAYTPISKFSDYLEGRLDFMVKIYPDGQMTQYVATLGVGSRLLISPPIVTESLEGCRDLVMIAGGSAVTVAIQICEEALRLNPNEVASIQLLMCNSKVENILYQDVFDGLLKKYPSFRLVHCISSEIPAKYLEQNGSRVEWHQGRLTKEVLSVPNATTRCMVSGPSGLCKAVIGVWKSLEQDEERLHVLDELLPDDSEDDSVTRIESDTSKQATQPPSYAATPRDEASTDTVETTWTSPITVLAPAQEMAMSPAEISATPRKPDSKKGGLPGLFASLWRPLWCTACTRTDDLDDGEGVPGTTRSVEA